MAYYDEEIFMMMMITMMAYFKLKLRCQILILEKHIYTYIQTLSKFLTVT